MSILQRARAHAGAIFFALDRLATNFISVPHWPLLLCGLVLANSSLAVTHRVVVEGGAQGRLTELGIQAQFVHDYGTFSWLEIDNTELAKLRNSGLPYRIQPAAHIQFLRWNFDPLQPPAKLQTPAPKASDQRYLAFVQLRAPATAQWLNDLSRAGSRVIQYYPHHTYLVWSDDRALENARNLPQVRWTGGFAPALRISPELERFDGPINNLHVHFYNRGNPQAVLDQLNALGTEVLNHFPAQPDQRLYEAIVRADTRHLEDLAQIPELIWMGYASPRPVLEDESGAQTVAANFLANGQPELNYPGWLTTAGVDGSGVVWSITDTGIDYSHGDLNTRIIGGFSYPGCSQPDPGNDPNTGGHGTHVAGILGGDGNAGFSDSDGYLYGLGVAPGVSFYAQNPICGSQNSWPPAGGWQELTKNPILAGAVGSNNSWTSGEGTAHGYQASERIHDVIVRDGNFDTPSVAEQFNIVFSAGNSGPGASTLTAPKEAKNVVVTGGTRTWRVSNDVDAMYNSSSRGPAVDGRYLPTIVAPGQTVSSTRNDGASQCASAINGTNGLYSFCTGTSMAAPHASGSLALITEWWRTNNSGANPSPAMGKALLINTATDISGAGPIPNADEGWGRISLRHLFLPEVPFEFFDQQQVFADSGENWTITVGVMDQAQPLKVSLVWSDAPGALGANPALVNDLNLTVQSGGQAYLGNVFNNGVSVPGGSPDTLNNIENVFIENPGGSATITVQAFNIAGDGVPYNADNSDQDFALVCNNCVQQPDYTLAATPDDVMVCAPDDAAYQVDVGSILGFSDPVTLSVAANPAGTSPSFSPNPVTPGNSSSLTMSGTGSVSPGDYSYTLQATASSNDKSLELGLSVFDQVPTAATLVSPADGATNQMTQPMLSWNSVAQAGTYRVDVDDNPDFLSIDFSQQTTATSLTVDQPLDSNTVYYWRVTVENGCGAVTSPSFSFITQPLPGDCTIDITPRTLFFDDMESGAGDWTHEGTQDTWQLSNANTWSGANAWYAEDLASISDQRLITPAIQLPSDELPLTLQYYNHQTMERDTASACWDAGILEISIDNGTTWSQIGSSQLLTDPYSGTVNDFGGGANPLAGLPAWCGDPQDWTQSIVDLSPWAGQNVHFRFRLGTDGTVGRVDGWKIDDVRVQSCPPDNTILADGFESNTRQPHGK